MSPQRLVDLLKIVAPIIEKKDTKFRKAISLGQRSVIISRFLASGKSQQSLSYSYRVGKATV